MDEPIESISDLPLLYHTPSAWAANVLREPLALLNDHAHLERKAASNALEMLSRWPDPSPPENWVQAMTAVARDEVEHLALVCRILSRRGGELTRHHTNLYARTLHDHVRRGRTGHLLDRLIISALIEARSCERFALLAGAADDGELAKLYKGLWASEAGHYRVFLALARDLPDTRDEVEARWREFLEIEADLIQKQPCGPMMHGSVGRFGE